MRNSTLRNVLLLSGLALVTFQACRKDDAAMMALPKLPDQSFVEEFDTTASAFARGWVPKNTSVPKGTGFWVQGMFNNPVVTFMDYPIPFGPHSSKGSYVGFIGTDFTSTSAAAGIISNWLISPVVTMQNGDKIIFYTRAALYTLGGNDSTDYGNSLEVRINPHNDGTNVGNGSEPGDFDVPLDYINGAFTWQYTSAANYDPTAYPTKWTKFISEVRGLSGPTKGRFAFRYYLVGGGSNGLGSGVGIDSVAYVGKR